MVMNPLQYCSLLLALAAAAAPCANGFQVPGPFLLAKSAPMVTLASTPTYVVLSEGSHYSPQQLNTILPSDVAGSITSSSSGGGATAAWIEQSHQQLHYYLLLADGGVLDIVRNIAVGITAVLFLLAGITVLYASFIIPAAAKELEKECKELDPQLWAQYEAKLGEGETMATRPDLMQELGTRLQPLLEAKILAMEREKKGGMGSVPTPLETTMNPFSSGSGAKSDDELPITPTMSTNWDSNDDDVIDVQIEKKVTDDSKPNGDEKK